MSRILPVNRPVAAAFKPRHRRRPSRAALRHWRCSSREPCSPTFYVNSSNTNSSPNGSQANPYETIQAAINASSTSCSTILVEAGKGYSEADTRDQFNQPDHQGRHVSGPCPGRRPLGWVQTCFYGSGLHVVVRA